MQQEHNPTIKDKIIAWIKALSIILIGFMLLSELVSFTSGLLKDKDYTSEEIREKMEVHLLEKYGEEFVVDRIGLRSSRGEKFYQARIYPKSIIGTNKEWDDYYYGELSMEIEGTNLGGIADTYGEINRSMKIEEYLLPRAKELFGDRTCLKIVQRYEKRNTNGYFISYLTPTFEEVMEKIRDDSYNNRLMLDLDVYVFKRIEDETEKEERRKQIFDFIQYLKEEDLFEYLEMGVIFIDERVLAPGYKLFNLEIKTTDKVLKEIEGERVYMPPMELREKMSSELQEEIDKMSEEELLESIREIRKSDMTPKQIANYNRQYLVWICSINMLKATRSSRYEREKKEDNLDFYHYEDINNLIFAKDLKYIFE